MDRIDVLAAAGLLKALRRCLLDAGALGADAADWLLAALVALHRDAGWTTEELRQLECVAAEIYRPGER